MQQVAGLVFLIALRAPYFNTIVIWCLTLIWYMIWLIRCSLRKNFNLYKITLNLKVLRSYSTASLASKVKFKLGCMKFRKFWLKPNLWNYWNTVKELNGDILSIDQLATVIWLNLSSSTSLKWHGRGQFGSKLKYA